MTSLHTPILPRWICAACARAWPCPTRRGQLSAAYDRAPACLALVMASRFVEASEDLHDVPAGELRVRFLGWLRGAR
ncbi:flavin reductase [Planosporangium thailandense]|uniref:Flavin reductase n=1 Tax=Planosporangium thailandense TaxID=765197 RepID=A0ABX0Y3N7_9ACTN|nr:flavin reductase [Planosporangium thailandense]